MVEHTAFGVYGIYAADQKLLVIRKVGGPYTQRFDLPGGSQEAGEGLPETLVREFKEETGTQVLDYQQLGSTTFHYPWSYLHYTTNRHVAVFYQIKALSGAFLTEVTQFTGQDSLGCCFIPLEQLTIENSSPLVLHAKATLQTGVFSDAPVRYPDWVVREQPET